MSSSSSSSAVCTLFCASNLPCVAKSFLSAGLLGGRTIDVNFLCDINSSKFNFCGRIFGDRGDEAEDDVEEGGRVGEREEEAAEEEEEEVVAGFKVEEVEEEEEEDRFL